MNMNPESSSSPFDSAIAELENRIQAMQLALETLKQLRTQPDGSSLAMASTVLRSGDNEVRHDTFFEMTIGDAARKYLTMTKATKSTADIATALEKGGLKHSSKDFPTTVRSVLGQRNDFTRVPNGDWGLSEWYPGAGRGKKTVKEPTKSRAARSKKPKSKGPTLEARIVELMKTHANKDWVSSEIATELEAQRESVQSTLSRLAKEKTKVVKAEKGYRLSTLFHAA